jgi:hypothetical protein
MAGLPSMVDVPPTFDEPEGDGSSDGQGAAGDSDEGQTNGSGGKAGEAGGTVADAGGSGSSATTGNDGAPAGPGTRAEGGMPSGNDGFGTMTAAEQVAILDQRLEESTGDFDALILEEQRRQRASDRQRAERPSAAPAEAAGQGVGGRNPYEDGMMGGGNSTGGGMGGVARAGGAPGNPAIYKPPEDIPDGNNDDVVARQLREAAMREPDPEVREKLWNEYRKYKGIDIPEGD